MAATLVAFVGMRLAFQEWVRPLFATPLRFSQKLIAHNGAIAICNALVGLRLVARSGDGYQNTPESGAFLVSTKPAYHGEFFRHVSSQLIPKWLALDKAVRTGNWEKRPDGNVEAGGIPLLEGEYSLRLRPLDERASRVLPGDAGVVTLELETDDELEAEGLARDVVRLVQQRRRDTGLEVSDRIRLTITTLPIVADAVKPWLEFVAVEDLVESEQLPSGQGMSIDLARATD